MPSYDGFSSYLKGLLGTPEEKTDILKNVVKGTGEFFNSDAASKLGAAAGLLDNSQSVPLNAKETNTIGGINTAFNALSSVPGVGPWVKGLSALNAIAAPLSGKGKADQFINAIPGLGALNIAVGPKTKSLGVDTNVANSSGFSGVTEQVKDATGLSGVKHGLLSQLFSNDKHKDNIKIGNAAVMQIKAGNILDANKKITDNAGLLSQQYALGNLNKIQGGGLGNIPVGKNGLTINRYDLKRLIKKCKKGDSLERTFIPSGALHAHKHNLDKHDDNLANIVTNKGVPVVSYNKGGEIIQDAEIERGEIIFTAEISKQLKELWKDGSDEAMIEAGVLIANEVVNETIDKSKEYDIKN